MKVCEESVGRIKYSKSDGMYMDEYLKTNLDHLVRLVNKSWDGIVCIDGVEGCGKTTLATQIGY